MTLLLKFGYVIEHYILFQMQESFQLAHETLYLAVVMTDLYMSKKAIKRDEMQLIGATSILLASKFYVSYHDIPFLYFLFY